MKCECGVTKTGGGKHSSWCPVAACVPERAGGAEVAAPGTDDFFGFKVIFSSVCKHCFGIFEEGTHLTCGGKPAASVPPPPARAVDDGGVMYLHNGVPHWLVNGKSTPLSEPMPVSVPRCDFCDTLIPRGTAGWFSIRRDKPVVAICIECAARAAAPARAERWTAEERAAIEEHIGHYSYKNHDIVSRALRAALALGPPQGAAQGLSEEEQEHVASLRDYVKRHLFHDGRRLMLRALDALEGGGA